MHAACPAAAPASEAAKAPTSNATGAAPPRPSTDHPCARAAGSLPMGPLTSQSPKRRHLPFLAVGMFSDTVLIAALQLGWSSTTQAVRCRSVGTPCRRRAALAFRRIIVRCFPVTLRAPGFSRVRRPMGPWHFMLKARHAHARGPRAIGPGQTPGPDRRCRQMSRMFRSTLPRPRGVGR
jgi:hypothetical protein